MTVGLARMRSGVTLDVDPYADDSREYDGGDDDE